MSTLIKIKDVRDYVYDPSNGYIHVRFWIDGKRHTRSTGVQGKIPPTEADVKKAISAGRKIIVHFETQKAKKRINRKRGILIGEEFEKWIEGQKVFRSPEYVRDITSRWTKHLKPYFEVIDVRDFTEDTWKDYALQFMRNNPGKKLWHHRAYMLAFLNHMHDKRDEVTKERILPSVPDLQQFDAPNDGVGRAATRREQTLILWYAKNLRHRLQFAMGFYMGMRPGKETCKAEKVWVNWETEEIVIPPSKHKAGKKTRRPRTIPIHPRVKPLLLKIYNSTDSEFLFPREDDPTKPMTAAGNRKAWARAKARAGIKGRLRRHDMRVTRATNNAVQGVPKALTQEVLGMTSKVLDHHYTRLDADRRRKVYEKELKK